MLIALDAMGGDTAPRDPVAGAIEVAREDRTEVLLVGDEAVLRAELARVKMPPEVARCLQIAHASEVVEMHDPPITPIRKKRDSSIRVAAGMVREGRAQALVSAGNTGAAMICAKMVIGTHPGVDRPALATVLPNKDNCTILIDVGANVDPKPEQLLQFGVMGHFYSGEITGLKEPRVGLLSIGEEQGKGNELTRESFSLLEASDLNFIGNVEGGDVFNGSCDVVVCDGFVGNVLLKSAESITEMVGLKLKQELETRFMAKLSYLFGRASIGKLRRTFDYSEYGGAPLLGLKNGCFIAHGRSNPNAIKNAIRRAVEFSEHGIAQKIGDSLLALQQGGEGTQEARGDELMDQEVTSP